ncbi:MAG: hypothetical protein AAGE85_13490 [Pseudomonadota bacterium]
MSIVPVVLLALSAGCAQAPDAEQALRDWVARGEDAVNREDRRELMSMVSPAYADGRGNGRDDIDRVLRLVFLRQDNVKVVTRIEELELHGGTAADLTLTAAFAGWNESLLGVSADALRFRFELEHDGDDWQLLAARWGELGGELQ